MHISFRAIFLTAALAVSGSGCSQLPLDGPEHRDIDRSATVALQNPRDTVVYDYALVDLNGGVLEALSHVGSPSLHTSFGASAQRTPMAKIGPGDVLQVAVFEAAPGGLFLPVDGGNRTGNFVTMPSMTVSRSGEISFPYAGMVQAAGRTVTEVEREIERKLAGRAIDPQVSISFVEQNASMVTVVGETINGANKFKISGNGDRVLDVIARAGGLRHPGYEAFVTLQRQGRKATVYFPRLVSSPEENIYVAPGDVIYVYREQQKFIAVGALGNSQQTSGLTGQFSFEQEKLNLNEALARAGGLQDSRANPSQVFVYRTEKRATLAKIGVDLGRFPDGQEHIPTIYRANYRDPSSFFFTQRFSMRHRDVIYVANSDATELAKFYAHIRGATSTVAGVGQDIVFTNDLFRGARIAR